VETILPVAIAAVVVLVLIVVALKVMYRVAEPNEALIISGFGVKGTTREAAVAESLGFKIISGKGTFVLPFVQSVRKLSLDLRKVPLQVTGVTNQSIPVRVEGVVIFKVGDDYPSIANAARRFLGKQDEMDASVSELSHGQLRTIVGELTVEELIRDRNKLTQTVRSSASTEMEKLGLVVDSFQIQSITDVKVPGVERGYIENLGRPQAAAVERDARIADAERRREAVAREQEAAAAVAEAERDAAIRQASARAETETAQNTAAQAGPLAEARARQQVIEAETRAAELEASLTEQRLQTEVRRPADARAYATAKDAEGERAAAIAEAEARAQATRLTGEAQAAATTATGRAEADAARAKALAEAEGLAARAEALATNQDAVINQQIAEKLPEIARAVAEPLGNVKQMVVTDGAAGLTKTVVDTLASAGALVPVARDLLRAEDGSGSGGAAPGNGARPAAPPTAGAAAVPPAPAATGDDEPPGRASLTRPPRAPQAPEGPPPRPPRSTSAPRGGSTS